MRRMYRNGSRAARRQVPGQKPRGCFQERVKKVAPERFAIIAVDSGKPQARARVADFYGNVLLEPFTFDISRPGLQTACMRIKETFGHHKILDCVAAIETTGRYHRPIKKAFEEQQWEPRDVHPFTTNLIRRAADESNKTDDTDLAAIHRAAVDGLAMQSESVDVMTQEWRVLARHRRDVVEKAATIKVQLKEAIHAYLPGYTQLWDHEAFWDSMNPVTIATTFDSPRAVQEADDEQFRDTVRRAGSKIQIGTIRRIRSWAHQAAPADDAAHMYRRRALALWKDLQAKWQEIPEIELDLADFLCQSPGVLLLAFSGINVVSASDYTAELGPLTNYAKSKSIAGRAGLYPSRYQTSNIDLAGALSARRNRQLRAALMRVARNLNRSNDYFMSLAHSYQRRKDDDRQSKGKSKVVIARSFSRLSYYLLAGEKLFRHSAIQDGEKILQKLLEFYHGHHAESGRAMNALNQVINRLRNDTLPAQRQFLAQVNQENQCKRRSNGVRRIGEILPAVLLRIDQRLKEIETEQDNQVEDATHGS